MKNKIAGVVKGYVKLWPREIFYIKDPACMDKLYDTLNHPGVYVLYQDFDTFYIGKSNCLFDRVQEHAMKRYHLWNHFSAFVVPDEKHLDDVESICHCSNTSHV